jgi:hypothetical protein
VAVLHALTGAYKSAEGKCKKYKAKWRKAKTKKKKARYAKLYKKWCKKAEAIEARKSGRKCKGARDVSMEDFSLEQDAASMSDAEAGADYEDADVDTDSAPSGLPSWALPVGLAVTALVVVGVVLANRQ